MPAYVVERLGDALNERGRSLKGAHILILGVAYKRDLDDDRESPAYKLMELLARKRAQFTYHDPFVPVLQRSRRYDFGLQLGAADRRAPRRGGCRVDRHRPHGVRLRSHRARTAAWWSILATPPRTCAAGREKIVLA